MLQNFTEIRQYLKRQKFFHYTLEQYAWNNNINIDNGVSVLYTYVLTCISFQVRTLNTHVTWAWRIIKVQPPPKSTS